MPKDDIIKAIRAIRQAESEQYNISIVLILTDGETLSGILRPLGGWPVTAPPDTIQICHEEENAIYFVFVPFGKIAGIAPLPYVQEQKPRSAERFGFFESVENAVFDETLRKASEHGFKVECHHIVRHLSITSISWGWVKFHDDTPLYVDWDYLSNKSGGIIR